MRLADGSEIVIDETLYGVELLAPGESGFSRSEMQLYIVPELKFDFVLGIPWLEVANPAVDWSKRSVSFDTCKLGSPVQLNLLENREKEPGNNLQKECSSNFSQNALTDSLKELPVQYREFETFCQEKEVCSLPPERPCDLEIVHKDTSIKPPFLKIYPLSLKKETILNEWIDKNVQRGLIRPSKSPSAAPIFFVKKKNGFLRPCIDYRELNSNTVRDGHPLSFQTFRKQRFLHH